MVVILSRVSLVALALLLAAGGRYALSELPATDGPDSQEVLLLPPGKVLRQLDLGHHALAADLLFIRANLYYGHHILTDEQLPWLSDFIDVLIEIDPDFRKAYLWGAMVIVFTKRQPGIIPQDILRRANQFLEAGMNRFPGDHRFPMRLAYNHYYELSDRDKALPYFSRAASLPGAPRWVKEKLVDLYSRKGEKELARQTLLSLIMETEDAVLNAALKNRLSYVMEEQERDELVAEREILVNRWRERYAVVPFDFFLLLRKP